MADDVVVLRATGETLPNGPLDAGGNGVVCLLATPAQAEKGESLLSFLKNPEEGYVLKEIKGKWYAWKPLTPDLQVVPRVAHDIHVFLIKASPEQIFEAWVDKRKDFFECDFEIPLSKNFGGRLASKVNLPCIGKSPCLLLHGLEPGITKHEELQSRIRAAGSGKNLFPVLGVSGCGKTRLAYELLGHTFGFYLVADVDKNGGSSDISRVQNGTQYGVSAVDNTAMAELATLQVILARLMIFEHSRKSVTGFTPCRWLMMQAYFKEFVGYDPFLELSVALEACSRYSIKQSIDKLWLDEAVWVLDEAQVLGTGRKIFQSAKTKHRRHAFSPILASLLYPSDRAWIQKHIVVILGTELSFLRLEESIVSKLAWFRTDMTRDELFIWDLHTSWSEETIQEYVSSLLEVDIAVVAEMCRWLVGRRRPVATFVQLILLSGDLPGAVLAEFVRVCTRENVDGSFYGSIGKLYDEDRQGSFCLRGGQPVDFAEVLRTVATFVLTVGDGEIIGSERNDLLLVEYGLGNVTRLERNMLVFTIDEPLVKEAMTCFAWQKGLVAHRLKSHMTLTVDVPSIGGRIWEKLACLDMEKWFKTLPRLEDCPCFQRGEIPRAWRTKRVELFGVRPDLLAIESTVDIQDFINGTGMWKFYSFDDWSGPDIMFFLKINGKLVPVFCQFKLRKRLSAAEANRDVRTTQVGKMYLHNKDKRDMLLNVCSDGYISMVIVFPVTFDPEKQKNKSNVAAEKRRLIGYVQEAHMEAMFAGSHELLCALRGVEIRPGKRPRLA